MRFSGYEMVVMSVLAIIVAMLWGVNVTVSKYLLEQMPALLLLTVRFFMVALLLLPFFPRPPVPLYHLLSLVSLLFVGHVSCMTLALHFGLDASVAVIVQQAGVPCVMLLAVLLCQEKLKLLTFLGVLLAMMGTVVLMGSPSSMMHPVAFFMMVLSVLLWSGYSIMCKGLPKGSGLAVIAWVSMLSVPVMLVASLIFERNQLAVLSTMSGPMMISLAYMVIFSAILAHGLWYYLLTRYAVHHVAPFILLVPLFGVGSAILLLQESITSHTVLGGVLMLCGVLSVMITRPVGAEVRIRSDDV
jgi:O-acetylserine/cysteine efflux transporter